MLEVPREGITVEAPSILRVGENQQTESAHIKSPKEKLQEVSESPVFDSSILLDVLTRSPGGREIDMDQILKEPVGVWEGYSLNEHTQMVMEQFERYFADEYNSSLLSKGDFRIMLALHDIGKPLAVKAGDKRRRHEYTRRAMEKVLQPFVLPNQQRMLITEISTQDHIGSYIKGEVTGEQAAANIKQLAQKINVPIANLTQLLITYYMCDAGSYTEDAGGKRSLDNLFVFNRGKKQLKGVMKLALPQQSKLDVLMASLTIKSEDIGSQGVNQSIGQVSSVTPEGIRGLGEIREFSESTEESREARQETTRKILQQRSRRGKVQEKIELVSQRKEEVINKGKWWKDEQVRQEQEVLALQAELRDRFSSWFLRVREKLRPSSSLSKERLEREILRRQNRLSEIQSGKTRFEVDYLPLVLKGFDEELRLLTEQRKALQNKSKEELRLFYEKFGKELARHKAGIKDLADLELYRRKEGTVQSLAERFNTYFVHAFSLYPGGRNNALLSEKHNLTWREKLFIEVVEKPAISASTISGDYPRDLWSPIGVFLGSGIVVDAEYQDMATRVNRMGKKEPKFAHPKNIGQYEEKITRAITSRLLQFGNEFRQWNEVILDDKPRPVGFFVNLDQKSYGQGAHHQSVGALSFSEQGLHLKSIYPSDKAAYPELKRDLYYTEIFDAANFVGLKVFAMKDGIAYEASLDSDGRLILGRSVSPNEMITMKAEIPPENLPKVREVINQFLVTNGTSMEIAMM